MERQADPLDEAGEIFNVHNEAAIEAHRREQRILRSKPSEIECLECGEPIPEARRAHGGIEHCIECAELLERRNHMYR